MQYLKCSDRYAFRVGQNLSDKGICCVRILCLCLLRLYRDLTPQIIEYDNLVNLTGGVNQINPVSLTVAIISQISVSKK
jgi:hypothetical protein